MLHVNTMIDELPLTVDIDKFKYIHPDCNSGKCKEHGDLCYLPNFVDKIVDVNKIFDIIDICKMPDRKILYDILDMN